jgi:hypothetical protein
MARYMVKFVKNLVTDTGQQMEVVQQSFDIDAPTQGEALELAKKCFCNGEQISEWTQRADRMLVEEADFPS